MREKAETVYTVESVFCGQKQAKEVYKEFIKKSFVEELDFNNAS